MFERAKRALPGMVMSLLLSVPALAAPSYDVSTRDVPPIGKPSINMEQSLSPLHSNAYPAIQRVSLMHASRTTGDVRDALIDDGTMWSERGGTAIWQQTGVASWYGGKRWQGHQTSSGTPYNENALTAAHATLPLGTKVRVTTHNGARSVIVTINDRPGTRTRIIDLSREAAKALGILDTGVAMVTLKPL